jgi:hypothetical protein
MRNLIDFQTKNGLFWSFLPRVSRGTAMHAGKWSLPKYTSDDESMTLIGIQFFIPEKH